MGWVKLCAAALALSLGAAPGARADEAGDFDYYVLALSWTPAWCAAQRDRAREDQCRRGAGFGFTLHGLWPQYERGWPEYCRTRERDPSRRMTREMQDIMGSPGLAWHQWKKHGRCTGLSATDYFDLSREAYGRVTRPEILRKIDREMTLDASVIEAAFLEANPELDPDGVSVRCKNRKIAEVMICLNRDLTPRICAPDVRRECHGSAAMEPLR